MGYNIQKLQEIKKYDDSKNQTSRCLHGLPKESCGYCGGLISHREAVKREPKELEGLYLRAKASFKSFGEDWTDEEILIVYEHFKDIHKRVFKKEVYKVALELERTSNAIRWMIKHLFSKREDLHRGQVVIAFRKIVGLEV